MTILIIVDMQNDFVDPQGSLYVPGAELLIPIINELIPNYDYVVASQDWHPENHVSFQTYPRHCVQNTWGAELHPGLQLPSAHIRVRKGMDLATDSPSAFVDDAGRPTGLDSILFALQGSAILSHVGVAIRVCVRATAIHAQKFGFVSHFLEPGCKDFGEPEGTEQAIQDMVASGVTRVRQLPE